MLRSYWVSPHTHVAHEDNKTAVFCVLPEDAYKETGLVSAAAALAGVVGCRSAGTLLMLRQEDHPVCLLLLLFVSQFLVFVAYDKPVMRTLNSVTHTNVEGYRDTLRSLTRSIKPVCRSCVSKPPNMQAPTASA